ncbi:S41 family peptidase [bacterium]|nr:S41 family peptidase [bacterium]
MNSENNQISLKENEAVNPESAATPTPAPAAETAASLSSDKDDTASAESTSENGRSCEASDSADEQKVTAEQARRGRIKLVLNFLLGMFLGLVFMMAVVVFIWIVRGDIDIGSDIKSETYSFTDSKGKTYSRELPVLDDTVRLIQKKFIRTLTAQELLNGAAENVNYTLDCFGLAESCSIKSIDDGQAKKLTDDELIRSFKNELIPVLMTVEKMPEDERTLHRSQLKKASKKKLDELEKKEDGKDGKAKDNTVESSALQQAKADNKKSEEAEKENNKKDDPDSDIVKDSDNKPIILDSELLFYSALNGLAYATEDPFTTALLPKEYKLFKQSMGNDEYGGVGIYLEADLKNNRQVTVIEPIEGTPADKAGICPGDKIMAIDGKKTSELEIDTASAMIRGKVDTKVKLTLQRGDKTFDVELTRTNIHVPSVTAKMKDGGIAYLRVRFFGEETGKEFAAELKKMAGKNAKALIIDLRNNGGGYIVAAAQLLSEFLPNGKTATTVVNPRLNVEEAYQIENDDYCKLPVILLVNRFSASASEITAGAFQDYHRALLIGETTYGKGSVQSLNTLTDGGAFKITIAHYLTPHNKDIHLKGITPDIIKEAEPTNKFGGPKDEQLNLALKEAKKLIDAGTKDFVEIKDSASKANPALHKDRSEKNKK